MDQPERQDAWRTVARIAIAALAGLVVLVLILPASGVDTLPPECYSALGYPVPCGGGLAVAGGTATAVVTGVVLWIAGRGRDAK